MNAIIRFFRWQNLTRLWQQWWFWLGIALVCCGLELAALYYQHVLEILPCELCIYVRVWLAGIFLVSLVGIFARVNRWGALLCTLTALALSIGLANETYNLLVVEYGWGHGGSCGLFANFPSWAPLDTWLPFLFKVQEFCAATPNVLFGITMAESLVLVCSGLIAALLLSLIGIGKALFIQK